MLGNRCLCDCYGNWPSWGGAGRGRAAGGPLRDRSGPRRGVGVGAGAPRGSGRPGSPKPDVCRDLAPPRTLPGAAGRSCPLGGEASGWGASPSPPEQVLRPGSALTRGPGAAWRGVAAGRGGRDAALRPQVRGGQASRCCKDGCLRGPGLGAPGQWGPLAPGDPANGAVRRS